MQLALLIILIVFSAWTIFVLRSAIVSLHAAGKSKEELANIKKGYSFIQRLLLLNVKDATAGTPKYNGFRKNIEKFLFGYMIAILVLWVLLILSVIFDGMTAFVSVLIIGKTVIVDIVVMAFYLKANTVIDKKNKLIRWKWANKN
ncbi:MAG: hypothetical protein IJJ41_05820 [Clostridia bacterium]|nr:hypothetical protein [Clostridia bacterium]